MREMYILILSAGLFIYYNYVFVLYCTVHTKYYVYKEQIKMA